MLHRGKHYKLYHVYQKANKLTCLVIELFRIFNKTNYIKHNHTSLFFFLGQALVYHITHL